MLDHCHHKRRPNLLDLSPVGESAAFAVAIKNFDQNHLLLLISIDLEEFL